MRDRDGWDAWDDRDDRDDRDVPPGGKPPKGGNGWLIGLIVGGVILLAAGGVALVVLLDNDRPPPPVAFANPPGGFGPGGIGPGGPAGPGQPPPDWTPADADVRRDVRDALRALGRDLQKPDFDPTARFAVEALATAGIDACRSRPAGATGCWSRLRAIRPSTRPGRRGPTSRIAGGSGGGWRGPTPTSGG